MSSINPAAARAREAARNQRTGEFGEQQHSPPAGAFAVLDDTSWMDDDLDALLLESPEWTPEEQLEPEGQATRAQRVVDRAIATLADPAATPAEREAAVRNAGEQLSLRAEELTGVTADELSDADQVAASQAWLESWEAAHREKSREHHAMVVRRVELRDMLRATTDADERAQLEQEIGSLDEQIRAFNDELQASFTDPERKHHLEVVAGKPTPERKEALARMRGGYLQALREVRDMGGTHDQFVSSSQRRAREAFMEASDAFPRDWVDASNAAGPLLARQQKTRAHYAHTGGTPKIRKPYEFAQGHSITARTAGAPPEDRRVQPKPGWSWNRRAGSMWVVDSELPDGTVEWRNAPAESPADKSLRGIVPEGGPRPKGDGWQWGEAESPGYGFWYRAKTYQTTDPGATPAAEIKTNAEPARLGGVSDTYATAVHELAHRAEYTVDGITELEHAFLNRRRREHGTDGQRPRRLYPNRRGNTEVAVDAGFVTPYVGKIYDKGGRRPAQGYTPTEVMSMGMEALFGGSHGGLIGVGTKQTDHDHRNFVLGVLAAAGRR
ncbi:MAG: hypothetical protein ACTH0V_00300 [Microbacteriaceae bacterium]